VLVAEVARQVLVDLDRDLVRGLEKEPRSRRDEQPDQGARTSGARYWRLRSSALGPVDRGAAAASFMGQ
jgi:hypothetical protein